MVTEIVPINKDSSNRFTIAWTQVSHYVQCAIKLYDEHSYIRNNNISVWSKDFSLPALFISNTCIVAGFKKLKESS